MRKHLCPALAAALIGAAAYANPAHDQIFAMPEAQRQTLMAQYLTASGKRCGNVSRTFYQGSGRNGDAFWNVACTSGASYQLMISNDIKGSTTLLDCKIIKATNAGTCFKKFKD